MPTGWRYNAQPRRLLTFKLGGKAKLPPTAPYDETVHPLDDPALVLDPAAVAAGAKLYLPCSGCHGGQAQSAGAPGPDLRESAIALDREAFAKVVRDGGALAKGMPRYAEFSDEQLGQLYSYIRSMARAEKQRNINGRLSPFMRALWSAPRRLSTRTLAPPPPGRSSPFAGSAALQAHADRVPGGR